MVSMNARRVVVVCASLSQAFADRRDTCSTGCGSIRGPRRVDDHVLEHQSVLPVSVRRWQACCSAGTAPDSRCPVARREEWHKAMAMPLTNRAFSGLYGTHKHLLDDGPPSRSSALELGSGEPRRDMSHSKTIRLEQSIDLLRTYASGMSPLDTSPGSRQW